MIVWLASYPRSGNTFFRLLLHHLAGLKTCSVYNDREFNEMGAADFIGHEPFAGSLDELETDERIHFVKTHDLPSDERPAVYLVRDGRDALVSFARYIQTFSRPRGRRARLVNFVRERILRQDFVRQTLEKLIVNPSEFGRWSFGGWSVNVKEWLGRSAGNTTLVRYENLITNPVGVFQTAIGELHLRLQLTTDKVPSFEELNSKWPTFFRKGKTGVWREEMSKHHQQLFWQYHGDAMRQLGYRE